MLESLTSLNAKSPAFVDNEPSYKHKQNCPSCKGRSRSITYRKNEGDCNRCNNTGVTLDTGGQRSTMNSSGQGLPGPQYIASLCSGIPDHKFWAAMIFVTDEVTYKPKLVNYLADNVISIAAKEWKIKEGQEEITRHRIKGLAMLAVMNLGYQKQGTTIKNKEVYKLLKITRKMYYQTWRHRRQLYEARLTDWVNQAEQTMFRNDRGRSRG